MSIMLRTPNKLIGILYTVSAPQLVLLELPDKVDNQCTEAASDEC